MYLMAVGMYEVNGFHSDATAEEQHHHGSIAEAVTCCFDIATEGALLRISSVAEHERPSICMKLMGSTGMLQRKNRIAVVPSRRLSLAASTSV